jgi:hypothetical protein
MARWCFRGSIPTTALRERNPRTRVVLELAVRRVGHVGVAGAQRASPARGAGKDGLEQSAELPRAGAPKVG